MTTFHKAIIALLTLSSVSVTAKNVGVTTDNLDVRMAGDFLTVNADLVLDSLTLGSNNQVFITPVIKGTGSQESQLPSVLVSGRKMHISYERGTLKNFQEIKSHDISQAVRRYNGKPQTVSYNVRVPLEDWMRGLDTRVVFVYDSCGCGVAYGQLVSDEVPIFSNPVKEMRTVMITPSITDLPVSIHEGKARVQFEVDRTELHVDPYKCKNGQRIDNRAQIAMIDDSVKYALTDPNVEISGISICGYASPESPYLHNDELATGRSKALAEYLGERYKLPKGSVHYSAVPENWVEFRKQVVESNEISAKERADLLELIDAPASTPAEYDHKEQLLRTDPRYKELFKNKILPEWFPRLRATTFAIHTRLKPLSDEALAKVIETTPEKMSLNQMFRVARLYPEGSDEFNHVIDIALKYYPNDPTAIINAAAAETARGEYAKAKELLTKVQATPEVYNLLGIIATSEEQYDAAIRYFEQAGDLPDAKRNLQLLKK
ncbi:MAG: DUF3868 domain-containing protein [Bacteroides sp.]|nr:DUF3868 domain-containing protein [Bacteroides sp.]